MPGAMTSVGNTSTDGDDYHVEEGDTEDERPDASYEDDYLAVDDEDEDDSEEIGQGTYGLGEY